MSSSAKTLNRRQPGDSYMELVRRLPLKTIKNDCEHEAAIAMLSELMGRKLDSGSEDYLDALIVLVTKYEDEHHDLGADVTPREALRTLMAANGLKQSDIGRIVGSESAVSMFLRGKRGLSKANILKLAERFKVDVSLFMERNGAGRSPSPRSR